MILGVDNVIANIPLLCGSSIWLWGSCLLMVLTLSSCDSGSSWYGPVELRGLTMGTKYAVQIPTPLPASIKAVELDQAVAAILGQLHEQMSTYDPESVISHFNRSSSTDWFAVPKDVCLVVEEAVRISQLSQGAFDITVQPLVNLWGFGPGPERITPPEPHEIATTLQNIGYQYLTTRCVGAIAIRKSKAAIAIDLSAIAQGYGADRVADYLDGQGIKNYLVDVGGELRGHGVNTMGKSWRIGIERPLPDVSAVANIVYVRDAAVATSGTYRNFFIADGKRYSHTIDPTTGSPITHKLVSVTVITRLAATADALATALAVLGPERGYALALQQQLAVIFIVQNGEILEERTTPQAAAYLTLPP